MGNSLAFLGAAICSLALRGLRAFVGVVRHELQLKDVGLDFFATPAAINVGTPHRLGPLFLIKTATTKAPNTGLLSHVAIPQRTKWFSNTPPSYPHFDELSIIFV